MNAPYPSAAKLLSYIQGTLSATEVAEIEEMIASDPGLAETILYYSTTGSNCGIKRSQENLTHPSSELVMIRTWREQTQEI